MPYFAFFVLLAPNPLGVFWYIIKPDSSQNRAFLLGICPTSETVVFQ